MTDLCRADERLHSVQRRLAAFLAIFVSFWALTFFLVAGEILLRAMGISLRSFQIAGGIVLFLYGLTMVLGETKETAGPPSKEDVLSLAIYPIAIPGIAGPGTILAIVVLTDKTRFSFVDQFGTFLILVVALLIVLGIFLLAVPLSKWVGKGGADVIRRIMGLVIASVAANTVLSAVSDWLSLAKL
ncbi:MAG: MarC family protein [Acetobacteraceae bacterium]